MKTNQLLWIFVLMFAFSSCKEEAKDNANVTKTAKEHKGQAAVELSEGEQPNVLQLRLQEYKTLL